MPMRCARGACLLSFSALVLKLQWIDSVRQSAGLWGAPGSKAQHTSPLIQGPGLIKVLQGPDIDLMGLARSL